MFGDFIKEQIGKRKSWSWFDTPDLSEGGSIIYAPHIPLMVTKTHDILPEKGMDSFKCPVCRREKGITFDIKYVADDLTKEIVYSIQADYKLSERNWIIRFKCFNCDTEWEYAYRIGCIDRKVTYVSTMPELDADSGIKDEYYKKLSIETDLK